MDSILNKLQKLPYYRLLLAGVGGLLLSLSWYPPFSFLIFFALLPFFILEADLTAHKASHRRSFFWVWLMVVLWNIGVYWWLFNAISWLVVAVWFINSGFVASTVSIYRLVRNAVHDHRLQYVMFVSFWVGFEYLHLNWSLTWPWVNIGHTLASQPIWIQWIEYTGSLGLSVWILVANILAYELLIVKRVPRWAVFATVAVPLAASWLLYGRYEVTKEVQIETVVVQPNFDCYTEKFENNPANGEINSTYVSYEDQIKRLISLSERMITPNTKYVFWPETALHKDINEQNVFTNLYLRNILTDFVKKHRLVLVTGADTYAFYTGPENFTPTANVYDSDPNMAYDYFNSAIQLKPNEEVSIYRKSKLVIGAETNPFIGILPQSQLLMMFKDVWATLGTQKERDVFSDVAVVAPVICYESVYGEYVTDYIRKGANLIAVITNDGWWDTRTAPTQHLNFSVMRAIENRRSVARAANTGISCFIDQRGDILQRSQYGEAVALRQTLSLNDGQTFYTKNGDLLGKLSALIAVCSLIAAIFKTILA